MQQNDLGALAAFLAIAEERSFTRAAKRLGVSPSAMSHAMRSVEESVGVRLLSRTTRSVAPTDAGKDLLARLRPALTDIQQALDRVSSLRKKPAGHLRLLAPRRACTKARSVCMEVPGNRARHHHQRQPLGHRSRRVRCWHSLRGIH